MIPNKKYLNFLKTANAVKWLPLALLLVGCATDHAAPLTKLNETQEISGGTAYKMAKVISNSSQKPAVSKPLVTGATNYCGYNTVDFKIARDKNNYADYSKIVPGSYPGSVYKIAKGDTLTLLAFMSGNSIKEIQRLNNLKDETLKVGQVVKLQDCGPTNNQSFNQTAVTVVKNDQSDPKFKKMDSVLANQQTVSVSIVPATTPKTTKKSSNKIVNGWTWPVHDGILISKFNPNDGGMNGIEITGLRGQPVYAAADGKVNLANDRIQGYGNLIMLVHKGQYNTSYSHNDQILVKEGDFVKAGQQIATLGSSGTDKVKLSFIITHRGKILDPLTVLPKN